MLREKKNTSGVFYRGLHLIIFGQGYRSLCQRSIRRVVYQLIVSVCGDHIHCFGRLTLNISVIFGNFIVIGIVLHRVYGRYCIRVASICPPLHRYLKESLRGTMFATTIGRFPRRSLGLFTIKDNGQQQMLFITHCIFGHTCGSKFCSRVVRGSFWGGNYYDLSIYSNGTCGVGLLKQVAMGVNTRWEVYVSYILGRGLVFGANVVLHRCHANSFVRDLLNNEITIGVYTLSTRGGTTLTGLYNVVNGVDGFHIVGVTFYVGTLWGL